MLEILILGTGGATATASRDNTCFFIKTNKDNILLDCPGSIVFKMKKAGEKPEEIDCLLLTHIHPDHVYGLPSLVHSLMLVEKNLFIYGSAETVDFAAELLDFFGLRQAQIRYKTTLVPLRPGLEHQIREGIKLKSIPTPHHSSSLAYLLASERTGEKWLFSGDSPPHQPLWEEAQEADVLIHEASAPRRFFEAWPELKKVHTDSFELGRLAARFRVPRLIPCHFFGEVDFSLEEIEAEIKANYSGELFIPHDLARWRIKK